SFKPEQIIFTEDDKRAGSREASRMYYIGNGEVSLTIGGRPLESVAKGEVFGEMAVITGRSRSATARARTACTVHSLDASQLQADVGAQPEVGLVLASVVDGR